MKNNNKYNKVPEPKKILRVESEFGFRYYIIIWYFIWYIIIWYLL